MRTPSEGRKTRLCEPGQNRYSSGILRRNFECAQLLILLILILATSCTKKRDVERPEDRVEKKAAKSEFENPRWVFHPLKKGKVNYQLKMADSVLEVDSKGSRWLLRKDRKAEVSALGAPESLVAAVREEGRFYFVGEGGTVYVSEDALGPFIEKRARPEPFERTRQVGKSLVAIGKKGGLFSSNDLGLSWKRRMPSEHFVDIGVASDGAILALSIPELWYRSMDGGRTFQVMDVESMAPRFLLADDQGELWSRALFHDYVYRKGSFQMRTAPPSLAEGQGGDDSLPRFARASEVGRGSAMLRAERYFSLRHEKGGGSWKLEESELGTRVSEESVEGLGACQRFLFSIRAEVSFVLCESYLGRKAGELQLHRSEDGAHSFKEVEYVFRGSLNEATLDISPSGEAAIGGLCPQEASERGCSPRGVTFFDGKGEIQNLDLPGLSNPVALGFDTQGGFWALGGRAKDGHAWLLGPVTPDHKLVPILDLTREAQLPARDPPSRDASRIALRSFGVNSRVKSMALLLGGRDSVSVVSFDASQVLIANVDLKGEYLGGGQAPAKVEALHGAGRYLLALSPQEGILWESDSGGLSWTQHPLPREICPSTREECPVSLACSTAGCLVGDELTRVGFSFEKELSFDASIGDESEKEELEELAGYSCRARKDDWVVLPGLAEIPHADDAALGPAAWAQVQSDPSHAAANALQVRWGSSSLERRALLSPVANPGSYAFHVSQQVEGSAAFRYRLPPGQGRGHSSSLGAVRVELAWDNRIEDLIGHGVLLAMAVERTSALPHRSADVSAALISVAGRGIYFRLTDRSPNRMTHFLRHQVTTSKEDELAPISWPSIIDRSSSGALNLDWSSIKREERIRIGGKHVGLLLLAGSRVVVRADGQEFAPFLMGRLENVTPHLIEGVQLAYHGRRIGFVSLQIDTDEAESSARFVELGDAQAFKEPVPVPLQSDLKFEILPCDVRQRAETPRVVAPRGEATARDVEVLGLGGRSLHLVTRSAVLFGTPEKPCVATFEAREVSVSGDGRVSYQALVYPGKSSPSWVFRDERTSQGRSVSVRSLSCSRAGSNTIR